MRTTTRRRSPMQHRKAFPAMALALGAVWQCNNAGAGRAGAVIYDNGGPSVLNVVRDQDDLGNVPGWTCLSS